MGERPRVGFIGVGDMGGPMVRHIIENGFPTTIWARRPTSLEQFDGLVFDIAADPAELGAKSDLVGICVFDDDAVREVLLGSRGVLVGLGPGAIVLVHSTVSVDLVRELQPIAADAGVVLLDAPVSGARSAAEESKLAVMVGGDRAAYERALPVLETHSGQCNYLGPIGSGEFMKLLNNSVYAANLSMAEEALDHARRFGMDTAQVAEVLEGSSAASFALTMLIGTVQQDREVARHVLRIRKNNIEIFRAACASAGIERTPLEDAAAAAADAVARYT